MSETRSLLLDMAVGILAGLAATKVTEFAQQGLWALTPEETREEEQRVRPGPPFRVAAEKTTELAGVDLDEQQTDRATAFVGQVNAGFPGAGAGDNIDTDKLIIDYWERAGAPPEALRDPRDREQIRVQRSQAQRAQEAAGQMGDLKAGAEGVKALAETPVAGGSASFFDKIINAS